MPSKINNIIDKISASVKKIISILDDNSLMLKKIDLLISKLIKYIKEYIEEYNKDGVEFFYKSDTGTIFDNLDKLEKFLESYFTKLFENDILDFDFVFNYKQILKDEIEKYKKNIEDDKKILFEVYQNYQKLEVKNIFDNFVLNDETKKFFDAGTTVVPYNEYIKRLTSIYIEKLKSFIMNVVINIANKKKLLLFEEIEQSLQDSEDTVLIMNSAIVYYQRMIYLKKKHDILEERNQELKSEKINQENNRQSILAKYNSDLQEKKTERDSKVQEINNANQQLNDETTLLKQINLEISEAKKSKSTAEKNKKVSDTALTKAKIDKHVQLRNAIKETSLNTRYKELQENIETYTDASQFDAIRIKFKSKPHVIKKIDDAVKAKTELAQAQLTSDSVNSALSVIEDSISNAKNRISEKQRLIDALKETKRLAELEISSIDEAIKLLLVKRNEDIQTFDKNIQTNDENIRVNDTAIQEIKGIVPKHRGDSSEDLKEIILTTGEIDIFRNFGIFPLYSRDEYLSDEQMERYLKGYVEYIPPPSKIIDYLISQEAVDKLFLFCGLNGIEQKKSCMDFFKLHNCKFSKENIILIDTQIKMLLIKYTTNKQIVKKATKAATTKVREELNRAKKEETEVKNKLFIAMLIKVCVSGNVKFYGLDESLDEIELQLFNFQKKLYNVTTKYLEHKRNPITP
jgi:hypothetical protein